MSIRISVVIPVYNAEKYLRECLDSLFPQCTDEVEVILVNDGSKDNSRAICEEYISRGNVNARLINQENSGSLESRNNGVRNASGEYIQFMDADDLLLDDAMATLLDVIHRRNCDMILFNATRDLESRKPYFDIPLKDGQELAGEDRYEVYKLLCCSHVLNNLWTKCIRKDLFKHVAAPGKGQRLTNGEDLFQILDLADASRSFVYLDRVFYYYRDIVTGISRVYNPYYFASEKIVCAKRVGYAEKWGRDNELVAGASVQTFKIMREIARKVFISNMSWKDMKNEMKHLRSDSFFRKYYFDVKTAPDSKYRILKAPFPALFMARIALRLKKGLGRA